MAYRQLKTKQPVISSEPVESLVTAEQVTAYLRQSSTAQVLQNVESADMQLTGAQRYAVSHGLDSDKIVIAHEGGGLRGVSGTLRIDQRDELQAIVAGIEAGTVRVVWAYSVSRLFRDKHGVQVATFIEVCARYGVKVVIETAKTFDFSNSFDVLMFQFLANVAARENEDRSKLLHEANARRARRGQYHGRPLVVGYIIDRDKDSPTYGRFKPYEPHARVVRWLYERYRALGGRFNLLASEVSKMPLVFDAFEPWVDQRDIHKLQLKRVPGGYHITKHGLINLLCAVEVAGYWKFDGEVRADEWGVPMCNHEPIVDDELWQYAFLRLSHTTLTGEKNTARLETRVTWTPATVNGKARNGKGYLLRGLLTSPMGTIQSSNGQYRVNAVVNEHGPRVNTLTVNAQMLDKVFMQRLIERLPDTDRKTLLEDSLRETRERHTRELVSVDKQIARYKNEVAGIEAFVKATGATADKETLQGFNSQLIDAHANLNALVAKKQAAAVEEGDLKELLDLLIELCETCWWLNDEQTRRYIGLATESVVIDEFSSHTLKLTVTWCEPFGQSDIAYIHREDGGHLEWTEEDEADLRRLYPDADRLDLLKRWPTRPWGNLITLASDRKITRNTRLNTSGITDRTVSLADKLLMDELSWTPSEVEPVRWVYDVTTDNDALRPALARARQSPIVRWVSELKYILAFAA